MNMCPVSNAEVKGELSHTYYMALPLTSLQGINNNFPCEIDDVLSMIAILKKHIKYCNDSITLVNDSLANIEVRTRRLCRTVGKILIIFMLKTSLAITAVVSNSRTALKGRDDNQQTSLHMLAATICCTMQIQKENNAVD